MSPGRPGRLIVLEGMDGCGKSTQTRLLAQALAAEGRKVRHVRDPGTTPLGERVRGLLLDPATGTLDPRTEALLFMACRRELVAREVLPALELGEVVLCERFHPSTICYQGGASGLGLETVADLARWTTPEVEPHLVVVLDLPVATALGRLGSRPDRLEARGQDFLQAVRDSFLRWAAGRKGAVVVAADAPPAEVASRVLQEVRRVLP